MLERLAALIGTMAVATGVYAAPAHSKGGVLSSCPSLVGLGGLSDAAVKTARIEVLRYGLVSRADDLADSDSSWQPRVRVQWRGSHQLPPSETREFLLRRNPAEPNPHSYSSTIVKRSCGAKILSHTVMLTTAPGTRNHPLPCVPCRATFFLVDRYGHPLIYFIN
jgi:hypothetical protein